MDIRHVLHFVSDLQSFHRHFGSLFFILFFIFFNNLSPLYFIVTDKLQANTCFLHERSHLFPNAMLMVSYPISSEKNIHVMAGEWSNVYIPTKMKRNNLTNATADA